MRKYWFLLCSFLVLLVVGAAWWFYGDGAWLQRIDETRYYEKKSNQVYVFKSEKDKQAAQQAIFFDRSAFLQGAEKLGEKTYLAESEPLSPVLDGETDGPSYTYAPKKGEVVWVEGLAYSMAAYGEASYSFNLDKGKEQVVLVEATISQTDYQVELEDRTVSFSTLSGQLDDSYITLKVLEE